MCKPNNRVKVECLGIRPSFWFLIIAGLLLLSPAFIHWQILQAAEIDEAVPSSYPSQVTADWEAQDGVSGASYTSAISKVVSSLTTDFAAAYNTAKASVTGDKNLYYLACHYRRIQKMKPYSDDLSGVMFARHHNFGGVLVGYHDNADAGNTDPDWTSKGALCVLNMKNYYSTFTTLLNKTDAVVRDPCISFDGKKVLFAMSGASKGTGYKIYEMAIADPTSIKQLTTNPTGLVVADFEPCYLPNGDIAFTSTRCFGIVDCAWNPTTNMYLMDGTGKYIRRVGYDQVNTFYPVLMEDGTVLYTRWEYNDRDLTTGMGLFVMNPDGCHQTEFFGNQITWPMTIIHGRQIPGTEKVMALAGGHHGPYAGELMIIDHTLGSNGAQSIEMIAPKRATKPAVTKSDIGMGNAQFLFQNPLPLDEKSLIVSWRKTESDKVFKLYFMGVDGSRELLAWDAQSLSQPVLIKSRKVPQSLATNVDYSKSTAEFTMENVYIGAGLKRKDGTTVAKGTAKRLRVIKIDYRAQSGNIGSAMASGSKSGTFLPAVTCPVSTYGASWECKTVLGETPIYEDGSASFIVPARTPVYFQVIDSLGYCIATMRSWSTLMPGEQFPCLGCHESKSESPTPGFKAIAGPPKALEKPLGIEDQPFNYRKIIQPIFDKNCVSCHKASHTSGFDLRGDLVSASSAGSPYTSSKRSWTTSYISLMKGIGLAESNKAINICTIFSKAEQQPAYSFGSSLSPIMTKVVNGTHKTVKLTQVEKNLIACWIDLCAPHAGTYSDFFSTSDSTKYAGLLGKRLKWEAVETENIAELIKTVSVAPDDYKNSKLAQSRTKQIGIQYLSKKRTLVLNENCEGTLMLLDLSGKMISRMNLSKHNTNGNLSVSLPASLSRGLYIARFEGEKGILQRMISVIK